MAKKKKKSNLQKRKDNPRSKYWLNKADYLWGRVIHELNDGCAINSDCSGPLEAHHLISRAQRSTRHEFSNGIILCSKHHKFCTKLSAHSAPLAFSEWLQENRLDQWKWCSLNKHRADKPDYKQAAEKLLILLEES